MDKDGTCNNQHNVINCPVQLYYGFQSDAAN